MKLYRIHWGYTILILTGLMLISGAVIYSIETTEIRHEIELHQQAESFAMDIYKEIIIDDYNQVISDLDYLSKQVEHSVESGRIMQVSERLRDFADSKKIYDQIRFLDGEGHERIRINYDVNGSVIVSEENLLDKSDRDYYLNARLIPNGEIYVSNLDLIIENGEIERPYKPVIRFVVKLETMDGYVILNYLAKPLIEHLNEYSENKLRDLFIANGDGSYLSIRQGVIELESLIEGSNGFNDIYPLVWNTSHEKTSESIEGRTYFGRAVSDEEFGGGYYKIRLQSGGIKLFSTAEKVESPDDFVKIQGSGVFNTFVNILLEYRYLIMTFVFLSIGSGYVIGKTRYEYGFVDRALKFTAQVNRVVENDGYLKGLVRYLAEEFQMDYALIDWIKDPEDQTAKTVAMYSKGLIVDNIEYSLRNTPCGNVYDKSLCCYAQNVQNLFPEDKGLIAMKVESYIGIPLYSGAGKAIGLIALMDSKKMVNRTSLEKVLQIVAVRAAQELERLIHDNQLKASLSLTENIVEATEEGVIVYDKDTTYKLWNKVISAWMEKTEEEIMGRKVLDVFPHLEGTIFLDRIISSIEGKQHLGSEYKYVNPSGKEIWIRANTKPLIKDGEIIGAIETLVDISDYKLRENKIEEALKEAEMANEAKSRFLANMSHELRTPMNGMIGMIQLVLMDDLNSEHRDQLLIAANSGRILVDILNDILDISALEAGTTTIRPAYIKIRECVSDCVNLFIPLAKEKSISLNYNVDEEIPKDVFADEKRMKQIITNIIGNAIKFTEKGFVNIQIELLNKSEDQITLRFSCIDSGVGIAEENINIIFDRFSQEDDSLIRHKGGAGLGLAISKDLVELMGGELKCESEKGVGSNFYFDLSLAYKKDRDESRGLPEIGVSDPQNNKKTLKILVVDDDVVSLMMLQAYLKKNDYCVFAASGGKEAIELHKNEQPDVILMDISMPDMNGVEAMKSIRKYSKSGHEMIIAQTAFAYEEDQEKFIEEGFDGYVSKPIDFAKLIKLLKDKSYN